MTIIDINYYDIITKANKIAELASSYNSECNKLSKLREEVNSYWQGDAATEVLKSIDIMYANMYQTYSQTLELSNTIKDCAYKIKKADEESAKQAKLLNS